MQLRNARLCLDCEELHTEQQCPICASESFAYVSRWVPFEERRHGKRVAIRTDPPAPRGKTWIAGGLAGVALFAASRWLFRADQAPEVPAPGPDDGAGD
jgi:hypothetical protein